MKKHYPWLWFDADSTLFDYNRAEATALRRAFDSLNLPFEDSYLELYRRINQELWHALDRREVTPAFLRLRRFEQLLETIPLTGSPAQLSTVYLAELAMRTDLVDGAYEVLQTLHGSSRIAIVTNGFTAIQHNRLKHSTIQPFVDELIISEEVGAAKPHAAFFDIVLARAGYPSKRDILLIGDSLTTDIRGGVEYGIDTCWYNPAGAPGPERLEITYEIRHLRDLLGMIQ